MKSKSHHIVLISEADVSEMVGALEEQFEVSHCPDVSSAVDLLSEKKAELFVTHIRGKQISLDACKALCDNPVTKEIPVLVLSASGDLEDRLKSFEAGCEDFVTEDVHPDELTARCFRIIFDKIANDQLKSQIQSANQAAFQAMSSTSDLGTNIQFFLNSVDCSNLDELGLLLMQTLNNYAVKCSLQIRGEYETKNMEANGMAKEMESNLLAELKDSGRYFDFGNRSVMNYEQVSLLVKNMPVDNPERYGQLKDNIFSLLQGLDARVKALDNLITLDKERHLMIKLVDKMKGIMNGLDDSFGGVMKESADIVEYLGEQITEQIQFLGLTEKQESVLENAISTAIEQNQAVFSKGLKLNENLGAVIRKIAGLINDPDNLDVEGIARLLDGKGKK